jgi:FtsH-binding integral membrane protein
MPHIRISLKLFLTVCLISGALFFLCCAPSAIADDDDHHDKKRNKDIGTVFNHVKNEKNNEATGQAAAWLLAAANITVLLSLLTRVTRYTDLPAQINDRIKRFNQLQKKFLLPVHYILNPLALGTAFVHFMSATSACKASDLPEWGIVLMALITGIGIMVKFKVFPKNLRKSTYQIHTNPIPITLLLAILLLGHAVVD